MSKNTHNKQAGSDVNRSDERIKETGEVFTPPELCAEMVSEIPLETLKNPDSTFLDNSAGCGNFLMTLRDELVKFHPLNHVLDNMIYAVEMMDDNHTEICERLGVPKDHPHYIRGDGLDQRIYTRWESEQPEPTEFKEGGGTLF